MRRSTSSERALVLAPLGRDAALAAAVLAESGLEADACPTLPATSDSGGRTRSMT